MLHKSAAEPAAQAYDEILAAFREIPSYGLANDDMLRAFLSFLAVTMAAGSDLF